MTLHPPTWIQQTKHGKDPAPERTHRHVADVILSWHRRHDLRLMNNVQVMASHLHVQATTENTKYSKV